MEIPSNYNVEIGPLKKSKVSISTQNLTTVNKIISKSSYLFIIHYIY